MRTALLRFSENRDILWLAGKLATQERTRRGVGRLVPERGCAYAEEATAVCNRHLNGALHIAPKRPNSTIAVTPPKDDGYMLKA